MLDNNKQMFSMEAEQEMISEPTSKKWRIPRHWMFWGTIFVLTSGGIGFTAAMTLIHLPPNTNCAAIFWPLASASLRIECAEGYAKRQTGADLLKAIDLVNILPLDHPLRPDINNRIEEWTKDLLLVGDNLFNQGKLSEAINLVKKVEQIPHVKKIVTTKINKWQSIWVKAEQTYNQGLNNLRESNWNEAFRDAVTLLNIGNEYWSTTKYNELTELIQRARLESQQLDEAFVFMRRGGVTNLIQAITLAQKITPQSFAYKEAQDLIKASTEDLLEIAKERLIAGDWETVNQITSQIPNTINLQDEIDDLNALAQATSQASKGSYNDLSEAIALASKVTSDRLMYSQAQQLISKWQQAGQSIQQIERAKDVASSGAINDLAQAVDQVKNIPNDNPYHQEAKTLSEQWNRQIEMTQDQPLLNRAIQLADSGNAIALQQAINEASQIRQGRALYQQSQQEIRNWSARIQQLEDQPILDQAQGLFNSGDILGAIAAAKQIPPSRGLYREAQNRIKTWQLEIQDREVLQLSYQLANQGTSDSLLNALSKIQQIRSNSTISKQAQEAANRWSYQLITYAQGLSDVNLPAAIQIVSRIPQGTSAYYEARQLRRTWQNKLEPIPTPIPPPITEIQQPLVQPVEPQNLPLPPLPTPIETTEPGT